MPERIYPLIEKADKRNWRDFVTTGDYAECYGRVEADIRSEDEERPSTQARLFSASEVGLTWDKFRRRKGSEQPLLIVIGDAIETFDKSRPWMVPYLSHLLAFEARFKNEHEYPLFATGIYYTHLFQETRAARPVPLSDVVPVVRKMDGTRRVLSCHSISNPDGKRISKEFFSGYFLAVR